MTYLLKLRCSDEAEWLVLRDAHLYDAKGSPRPGVQIVDLGTLYRETGNTITVTGPGGQPMQVPEKVASDGYHIDGIVPAELIHRDFHPYMVNPSAEWTKHVYAGNHVLAMPEALPEADEVLMVTRGIGQAIPDDVLARLDRAVLMGKITPEMAEDRRAWVEAGVAITESRMALAGAREQREQAVEAARKAADERARVLALRDAELAKRQAAADALAGKVGAARTPFIAARDAATAEASRLADAAAAKASKLDEAMKARDDAAAELQAAATAIAAARAQRDVLKVAVK